MAFALPKWLRRGEHGSQPAGSATRPMTLGGYEQSQFFVDQAVARQNWKPHPDLANIDKVCRQQRHLSAYKDYYDRQWDLISGQHGTRNTTIQSGEELMEIVKWSHEGETREVMLAKLESNAKLPVSQNSCSHSLNLAARLLTMFKVGRAENQVVARGCLDWQTGTLQEFTTARLAGPPELEIGNIRITKSFDAWSIHMVGGLEIGFTDNLADHLLLVDEDRKLLVFHHVSFLHYQHNSPLFPAGFVDETKRTLALLFPQDEFGTIRKFHRGKVDWLQDLIASHARHQIIDDGIGRCGTLRAEERRIERFPFWRDRLVILKQAFDEASPTSLSQWWHDRRSGERWYTFWVAILVLMVTAFLGLVQCVESALQVYKAYHP